MKSKSITNNIENDETQKQPYHVENDENDNDNNNNNNGRRKRNPKRNPKRNRTKDENDGSSDHGNNKSTKLATISTSTSTSTSKNKNTDVGVDAITIDDGNHVEDANTSNMNQKDGATMNSHEKSETHENNPRTGEKDISQTALSKLSKRQKEPSSSSKGKKQNHDEKHSIEALLSVPLKYILRKTTKGRNQHQQLLSKTEATAFLQISNLAYELDILVHMATSALYKSHFANQLSTSIITLSSSYSSSSSYYSYYHHYLQPIHVLLKIHGETIPHQILQHVQTNMERILLVEFPVLSQILHQSSEQNWSVSNAFGDDSDDDDDDSDDDAYNDNESGNGNSNGGGKHTKKKKKKHKSNVNQLGREKGILAELEEEVCKRMNGLIEMANMDHAGGAGVSDGVNGQSNDYDDNASNMDVDMDDTTDRDIFDLMTAPKYKKEEGENSGGDDDDDKQFMSMARLCQNLFNDRDTKNGLQHDSNGKNGNVV